MPATAPDRTPSLADVIGMPGIDEGYVLALAAALAAHWDHALAAPIAEGANLRGARQYRAEAPAPGTDSIAARIRDAEVRLGTPEALATTGLVLPEKLAALIGSQHTSGRAVLLLALTENPAPETPLGILTFAADGDDPG
ncbi:hypothetical protein EMQ25_00255 [Arsenicitalea aurantiaca]|uniref:Uncharacterized protein n=1 Tax=Arsenicitalea aurantiaca TaxID=1783274 RepID=A0A433XK31_9HYPH|nr:hypothetical protein [Arsenicitalea aurantiaca]RUT34430.1 hypothetical protein EMQ25_00255 [Arsenicitalea aurantiaca]